MKKIMNTKLRYIAHQYCLIQLYTMQYIRRKNIYTKQNNKYNTINYSELKYKTNMYNSSMMQYNTIINYGTTNIKEKIAEDCKFLNKCLFF